MKSASSSFEQTLFLISRLHHWMAGRGSGCIEQAFLSQHWKSVASIGILLWGCGSRFNFSKGCTLFWFGKSVHFPKFMKSIYYYVCEQVYKLCIIICIIISHTHTAPCLKHTHIHTHLTIRIPNYIHVSASSLYMAVYNLWT